MSLAQKIMDAIKIARRHTSGMVVRDGWCKAADGRILDVIELLAERVRKLEDDVFEPRKEVAPPTAPIPAGLMMVGAWENALKGGAGGGYLGMKYIDGEWDLNFWPVLANPEIWLLPMIGRPK